ncbi:hypothetical protein FYJ43_04285 [Cutibacterium sp. WCA-380-WT-3A]|uniref:Uncharacterized protein n=1 Tax=Cutibacterium porci TaxID=2605781 RepID=A0A7K0J5Q7_9ACTN|nr:hypothetical protein [Cutibacterium porci]MSS45275.1 hypothetical protein [Cutibacterium porci]
MTGPRDLPWLRHELLGLIGQRVALYADGPRSADAATMRRSAKSIAAGSLWWVSADMTRVALDASQDMPAWSIAAAMPDTSGLLWWAGRLPAVRYWDEDELAMHAGQMTAIMWCLHDGAMSMVPIIRLGEAGWIMPTSASISTAATSEDMPRLGTARWPDAAGVLSLLGATWTLMVEPQVAERRHRDQPRRDVARAARARESTSPITIVDLRPMRTVPEPGAGGESGRRLHVRHVVRGHWRQQWYPSSGEHRPRWIHSYLKGPDGAPVKASTPVMVWRR